MVAEGLSTFNENPKYQACSRRVSGRIVEMENDFSSSIFVTGGWTDSINFVKNMISEILSIKAMFFWKNLDERETEWGPENAQHSFWAADCLP
jgi:hypothetical protein